jgi:hypothetical protein
MRQPSRGGTGQRRARWMGGAGRQRAGWWKVGARCQGGGDELGAGPAMANGEAACPILYSCIGYLFRCSFFFVADAYCLTD